MRGTVLYSPRDIHFEERAAPTIMKPTFDLTLPLAQVAEGYRAMDERCAIKTLLRP